MKIFIICCLLFIHVNMCIYIYIRGFRVSIRVSGIRSGFGYPRVWFWWWISTRIGFRGGFGFRFRVSVLGARRLHPIRTRPVAILNPYIVLVYLVLCWGAIAPQFLSKKKISMRTAIWELREVKLILDMLMTNFLPTLIRI